MAVTTEAVATVAVDTLAVTDWDEMPMVNRPQCVKLRAEHPFRLFTFPHKTTLSTMKLTSLLSLLLLPFAMFFASCKPKGPVEKAGEGVDSAVERVKDAVNPKGPVEKAGEKVDKALGR